MSTKQDRIQLKTYFEWGDRPTDGQFSHLIDSGINQEDDLIYVTEDKDLGIGTKDAKRKLHVSGKAFISTDFTKDPITGNALEIYAGSSHGIGIDTFKNDVFNFRDSDGSNPNPFTITDNSGRGFRFYKHGGSGANGEQLRIAKNGNVGVGAIFEDATSKLQVQGASADEDQHGILRIETPNKLGGANLRMGVLSGSYSWIQAHGAKPLHINKIGNDTLLNLSNGNVGIGVAVPDNKLHLDNGTKANTGLQLSTGAQGGHVLVSDGSGNASWQSPTVVTSGLWQEIGNTGHIENGNGGNVGVGTNDPQEKLHIQGNLKVDGGIRGNDIYNKLNIGVTGGNGGAYISLRNNDYNGNHQGGMIFAARRGPNSTNGFAFLQYNPGETSEWPRCMTITGAKDSHFWNNGILLRHEGDKNHGLAFFGTDSPEPTRKDFNSVNVDGPVLFGYNGGALGGRRGNTENIALRWKNDQSVDFGGKVTAKSKPLIRVQKCSTNWITNINDTNHYAYTGIKVSDYPEAFVVKHYPERNVQLKGYSVEEYNNNGTNEWRMKFWGGSNFFDPGGKFHAEVWFLKSEIIEMHGF